MIYDLDSVLALESPTRVLRPVLWMRRKRGSDRSGGAIAVGPFIVTDANLADAPPDVRRAVIAHELGHIRLGHTAAMAGAFFLLLLYALSSLTNPPTVGWVIVNCTLLVGLASLALWATRPAREFEADDYAASLVGPAAVATALRWSLAGETASPLVLRRLEALAIR